MASKTINFETHLYLMEAKVSFYGMCGEKEFTIAI